MKRLVSLILCLLIFLTVFSSCGEKEGETLTMYYPIVTDVYYLDPQVASAKGERVFVANCFEGLVTLNSNNEIIPGVAKSWSVSSDGLKYIFNLRTDSKWHVTNTSKKYLDKLPENFAPSVTAYDFEFGLKRALSKDTDAPDGDILSCIKNGAKALKGLASPSDIGVKATGNYTLEITLDYADSDFLYSLTRPVAMPCNEIFFNACSGRYGLSLEYMLCNGPYFLYSISEGISVLITKSDDYKGEVEAIPDNVYLYVNTDANAMAEKVRDDKYDGGIISAQMYNNSFKNAEKFTVTPRSSTVWAYCFNQADEYLANAQVRRAFAYGFDNSLLKSDTGLYEPVNRLTTEYMTPSYKFSPKITAYDEAKANLNFKQGLSGFEDSLKSVTVLTTEEFAPQVKEQIQKWQKCLGIDVKIKTDTLENVISSVTSGEYQIAFCPVSYESERVFAFLGSFATNSSSNIFSYSDSEYDNLLESVRGFSDPDSKIQTYKKLEQKLIDSVVMIPVFTQNSYFVMGKGVSDIVAFSDSEVYFKYASRK